MTFARYGIYYTPLPGPFASAGATWLGWDLAGGEPAGAADDAITERPRRYGFHGTVKPPFRLAGGTTADGLKTAFINLCGRLEPACADALEIKRMGRFLALTPTGEAAGLAALAAHVVRDLDVFRAPPTDAELARRRGAGLSPEREANLLRWGYPHVMDAFRFHMTLTGPLDDATMASVKTRAQAHFRGLLPAPFRIDSLTLVGEDPDGMFHEVLRCPLGTSMPEY